MPSAPPLPRRWDESDDVSTTVGSSAASAMADASCEPSRLAAIAREAVSSDVESLGHAFMSLDVQVTEFIAGISRLEQRLDLVSEQADFLGGDVRALLQERRTGTARGLDMQALLTHRLSGLQCSVGAIARFGVNSRRLVIGRHLLDAAFAALLSWCDRCRGWRVDLRVSALERVFVQWVRFVEDRRLFPRPSCGESGSVDATEITYTRDRLLALRKQLPPLGLTRGADSSAFVGVLEDEPPCAAAAAEFPSDSSSGDGPRRRAAPEAIVQCVTRPFFDTSLGRWRHVNGQFAKKPAKVTPEEQANVEAYVQQRKREKALAAERKKNETKGKGKGKGRQPTDSASASSQAPNIFAGIHMRQALEEEGSIAHFEFLQRMGFFDD